jgi:hypothetical protein
LEGHLLATWYQPGHSAPPPRVWTCSDSLSAKRQDRTEQAIDAVRDLESS